MRLFATVAVIALLLAAPASATFPGKNGPISFNRFAELPGDQLVTNLFAVDPDGSDLSQLTDFGAETFSELSDHSPDGRTLAFQRFDFVGEESPPPQIWLTDADGSHARQLTDIANGAFDPAFAPDGRTLAIDSDIGGAPGIFLIPAKAQGGKLVSDAQARRVTRGPAGGFDSEPQISPDGKWVVFTRYSAECADDTPEDCQTRIYKVRTNGKDLKLLVGPDLNPSAPDWHPTGLVIAFDTHDNTVAPDDGHIMVMLANGSLKHVIVRADADSYYQNPSFSPDGTRIAYAHWPLTPEGNADETLRSSIWTAWVTGAKPKQITRGEWDNKPDWGPAPRRH